MFATGFGCKSEATTMAPTPSCNLFGTWLEPRWDLRARAPLSPLNPLYTILQSYLLVTGLGYWPWLLVLVIVAMCFALWPWLLVLALANAPS